MGVKPSLPFFTDMYKAFSVFLERAGVSDYGDRQRKQTELQELFSLVSFPASRELEMMETVGIEYHLAFQIRIIDVPLGGIDLMGFFSSLVEIICLGWVTHDNHQCINKSAKLHLYMRMRAK